MLLGGILPLLCGVIQYNHVFRFVCTSVNLSLLSKCGEMLSYFLFSYRHTTPACWILTPKWWGTWHCCHLKRSSKARRLKRVCYLNCSYILCFLIVVTFAHLLPHCHGIRCLLPYLVRRYISAAWMLFPLMCANSVCIVFAYDSQRHRHYWRGNLLFQGQRVLQELWN